jgi:hypothetical protein
VSGLRAIETGTLMSTMQVHTAKLAAGDAAALALAAACARGGVTICRYPVPADKMKVGETLAVSQLARLLARFGEEVFVAALACITRTGNGHPGLVRAPLVEALAVALEAEPAWRGALLHSAVEALDLDAVWRQAQGEARMSRTKVVTLLVDAIGAHLDQAMAMEAV